MERRLNLILLDSIFFYKTTSKYIVPNINSMSAFFFKGLGIVLSSLFKIYISITYRSGEPWGIGMILFGRGWVHKATFPTFNSDMARRI